MVRPIENVAVLGAGLIGGSVGLGLRAAGTQAVTGFDVDGDALRIGLARGAFTAAAGSVAEAVAGAALVILATPVEAVGSVASEVARVAAADAVVTDVGSAKRHVVDVCEAALGERFVGGHPMAGSEQRGMSAASADLFEDAWWILTPTATTSSDAYRTAALLAGTLRARPVALDPADHDRVLAQLSHLPQLAASALVWAAVASEEKESHLGLAATGFRDVTRIAASDPGLWVGILEANREAVLESLRGLQDGLERVRKDLAEGDWEDLRGFLASARSARLGLFGKPELHDVAVALSMPVLDRPGVLAEVTTAAGALGANIEDLRIVHSTEGGRGRLELIVAGEGPATALAEALGGLGYRVERDRIDT